MKKLVYLFVLLCNACTVQAQNLVFNGNFETYSQCPISTSQTTYCTGWRSFTTGSSDFFHTCGSGAGNVPFVFLGFQQPASGAGFTGGCTFNNPTSVVNTYKEMVAGTLITPLQIGMTYNVSVSVNLANNSAYGTDDLGIYFYKDAPSFYNTVSMPPVTPQITFASYGVLLDTVNWVRLSATFVADSAYNNIVIGGWQQSATVNKVPTGYNSTLSYYYFDSLVVQDTRGVNITYTDSLLCAGNIINVPYTLVSPTIYNTNNIFTLQLSNIAGSFATPTILGTLASTTAGSVTGMIPGALTPGTGYRMRIVSSAPFTISDTTVLPITYGNVTPIKPVIAQTSPVCVGSTLSLLSNSGPTGISYAWTGPNGFTSTQANPTIPNTTFASTGNYILKVKLFGCLAADTEYIVIQGFPTPVTAGSNSPVCSGSSLNLTSTNSSPGSTYSWTGPLSYSSSTQNPSATNIPMAAAGDYILTASLGPCSVKDTVSVVVKQTPENVSANSNSPVCAGGVLNLSASSTTPGVTYSWAGPNSFISTLQNPVIDPVAAAHAGVFTATASLNGCDASAQTTAVVNTITYLGAYASPNDTICIGKPLAVVTVPVNGGVNPTFQWFNNSGPITGATNVVYNTTTAVTGDSFYCRMIAGNVCNTPLTLFSNKIGITVLPQDPSPAVTISSVPANPLPGNAVTFTAIVTNSGANPLYQWLRNGQNIVGAVSNTWSANNLHPNDVISVKVTSGNPCPSDSFATSNTVEVRFPTSVNADGNNSGFYLYPNPNNGTFTLEGNMTGSSEAEIWNELGQIVYTEVLHPIKGILRHTITLNKNIAPGVYLLRLKTNTESKMIRFTISK